MSAAKKPLELSLIIPAYNEETYITGCLDSVAKQSVMPDEVIVVDNNSTDKTVELAKSYGFVKVINEKKQGLIAARNRGFKEAKGKILARIDADSILEENWVEVAIDNIQKNGADALSGPGYTQADTHLPMLKTLFWSKLYHLMAFVNFRFEVLWGANMVIKRSAWLKIKDQLSLNDKLVHEDLDISTALFINGLKAKYVDELRITTDGRRQAYLPKAVVYTAMLLRSKKRARLFAQAKPDKLNYQISVLSAGIVKLLLVPFGVLYVFLSIIYTLECWLGLRKRVR